MADRYRHTDGTEVEAAQLFDDLAVHVSIATWVESAGGTALIPFLDPSLFVETPDGRKVADLGDWIIRKADNTFTVCAHKEFAAAYELVRSEAG